MGKYIALYQFPSDGQSLRVAVSTFKGLGMLSPGKTEQRMSYQTNAWNCCGEAAQALHWDVHIHYLLWCFCFIAGISSPWSRDAFLKMQAALTLVVTFTAQCLMVIFTQSTNCTATGILRCQRTSYFFGKIRCHLRKKKALGSSLLLFFVTL